MAMMQHQQLAEQAREEWDEGEHEGASPCANERKKIAAALARAGRLIAHDPDAAAALLDGVVVRIGMLGLLERERRPERARMLHELDECAPGLARRLRLALRAPGVEARCAHALACLRALDGP